MCSAVRDMDEKKQWLWMFRRTCYIDRNIITVNLFVVCFLTIWLMRVVVAREARSMLPMSVEHQPHTSVRWSAVRFFTFHLTYQIEGVDSPLRFNVSRPSFSLLYLTFILFPLRIHVVLAFDYPWVSCNHTPSFLLPSSCLLTFLPFHFFFLLCLYGCWHLGMFVYMHVCVCVCWLSCCSIRVALPLSTYNFTQMTDRTRRVFIETREGIDPF